MKINLTESEITQCFREVLYDEPLCDCEEYQELNEALSPADKSEIKDIFKKEIKSFLDVTKSSDFEKKVEAIVARKVKGDKDLEKRMLEVTKNVLVQLYKALWTKRNIWVSDLKNISGL